jgi:hypothetical protein
VPGNAQEKLAVNDNANEYTIVKKKIVPGPHPSSPKPFCAMPGNSSSQSNQTDRGANLAEPLELNSLSIRR